MFVSIHACDNLCLLLSFIHHSSFLFPFSPFISSILHRNFILWLIFLAISGCACFFFFFFRRMSLFFDIFFIGLEIKKIKIFDHLKSDFLIKLYSFFFLLFFSPYLFSHSSYNTTKLEYFFFFN